MKISRQIRLRTRNASDKSCRENQNTHFTVYSLTFFPKIMPFMRCGKIWYSRTGQFDMAHALCKLYNWGYRHTLRICNTYGFSMATMVRRTRGELSYLAPLGSENISAPYFKQYFFRWGGGYYSPDWVKHHAPQSQDRNNKYFILYIEFCINNKI